ncbi:hypothetical protein, partial [Allobaculum fili]|uniref:hypothetical protein n=1 Tax=Allobaculum fili TaxID=2834460 RepID=UPI001E3611A2
MKCAFSPFPYKNSPKKTGKTGSLGCSFTRQKKNSGNQAGDEIDRKRQIKDGYFLDRLLGIIPLFKEAFSWNQSSLQSISVSISPK